MRWLDWNDSGLRLHSARQQRHRAVLLVLIELRVGTLHGAGFVTAVRRTRGRTVHQRVTGVHTDIWQHRPIEPTQTTHLREWVSRFSTLTPTVATWVQLSSILFQTRLSSHLQFLTSGHSVAQGWASECPDVKNYKRLLNPVWHKMLYTVAVTIWQ